MKVTHISNLWRVSGRVGTWFLLVEAAYFFKNAAHIVTNGLLGTQHHSLANKDEGGRLKAEEIVSVFRVI